MKQHLWLLAGLALPAACRSAPQRQPDATLVLRVAEHDHAPLPSPLAYIDDQAVPLPPGGALRVVLPAGLHRVAVRADGHFPAYREISLPPRQERTLEVRLRPDPDAAPPGPPARP